MYRLSVYADTNLVISELSYYRIISCILKIIGKFNTYVFEVCNNWIKIIKF